MQAAAERAHRDRVGPFEVTGVLGEGGSAVVYAAVRDGQPVALKVPREAALTQKETERFLAEAKMLARVTHPSIARVVDSGVLDDGAPYLAMQRYSGDTLAQRLARSGALPLPLALELFEQIADATSCLHAAELVHRDLKSENVVLADDGTRAVLLDFGIAKDAAAPASTTTQSGVARGTPATMAPERFFGAPATVSSDVYELAVLLYAMLVGRLPWTDVTNVEARLNPAAPSADVPSALSTVILRALSTRPERRPRSAEALLEAVRNAVGGTGPKSGRVTAATAVVSRPDDEPSVPSIESAASDGAQVLESPESLPAPTRPSRRGPVLVAFALLGGAAIGLGVTRGLPAAPPALRAILGNLSAPEVTAPPSPSQPVAAGAEPAPEPKPADPSPQAAAVTAQPAAPKAGQPAPKPAPSGSVPAPKGKPKGAPCTRSSECASMICAAETCQ